MYRISILEKNTNSLRTKLTNCLIKISVANTVYLSIIVKYLFDGYLIVKNNNQCIANR